MAPKMFIINVLCLLVYLSFGVSKKYGSVDTLFPLNTSSRVDFEINFNNLKKLPRFWTNTGFCPPAPTNSSSALKDFFLGEKTLRNVDYISALPNNGLKVIRIHWLLNLIKFV